MLVNALFYAAIAAVAASAFLGAGLTMTRAAIHRVSQTYLAAGFQRASSVLQQTIASDMQSGGLPSPLPSFAPLPATCVDASNPCRYTSAESIQLTQVSTPAPAASCDPQQTNCASNEQANTYVDETRVAARITVKVYAADGSMLASRSDDVILRTTKLPPYAVVAGTRDATFDEVAGGHAAGDDGGILPATPQPCASASPGTTDDTAVRVAYRNKNTNACTSGSAWRTQSYSSTGSTPGWSP